MIESTVHGQVKRIARILHQICPGDSAVLYEHQLLIFAVSLLARGKNLHLPRGVRKYLE